MIGIVAFTAAAAIYLAVALLVAGTFWTIPYLILLIVSITVFDRWLTRNDRRPTR